jgi:hypothetical protein
MKETKKILITVKTYPTPSTKYDELVCTAGVTKDGKWVRLYPIEFRRLPYDKQYKKYDWIEILTERNSSDFRKESFRPIGDCKITGHIGTENNWEERSDVLSKLKLYTNMKELIKDSKKPNYTSLAFFKPTEILDFIIEEQESKWSRAENKQLELFLPNDFKRVNKLPFKFKYEFKDDEGKTSKLSITDWELGALFFKYKQDYKLACQKVKEKYFDDFTNKKDLYFFLGTTKEYHNTAKNPFIIIGTFRPPKKKRKQSLSI